MFNKQISNRFGKMTKYVADVSIRQNTLAQQTQLANQGNYQGNYNSYTSGLEVQMRLLQSLDATKSMYIKLYQQNVKRINENGYIMDRSEWFLTLCKKLKIDIDENDLMQAELL